MANRNYIYFFSNRARQIDYMNSSETLTKIFRYSFLPQEKSNAKFIKQS